MNMTDLPGFDSTIGFQDYVDIMMEISIDNIGYPLSMFHDVSRIDDDSLQMMYSDYKGFLETNQKLLTESGLTMAQIGHDFGLTRNKQGTGFWDRELGSIGDKLTSVAEQYDECELYKGDDGKIYYPY